MTDYGKKVLAVLLALLMITAPIGCAEDTGSEGQSPKETAGDAAVPAETEETEPPYSDNLPADLYYEDRTIRFLTNNMETKSIELREEDDVGDVVNDAYYRRNEALNERLGVTLERTETVHYDNYNSAVNQFIQAGTDDYDILCGHARFNVSLAANGAVLEMGENGVMDYVDITKPYWSQLWIENANYGNHIYWLTGDLTERYISTIYALFVNMTVWNNHYSEDNLYDLVLEGKWTFDRMTANSEGLYSDLNHDGNRDIKDAFGVVMQKGHTLNGMMFGLGMEYSTDNGDGNYSMTINNEHTIDIYNKLYELYCQTDYGFRFENYDTEALYMLSEDRVLFVPHIFGAAENAIAREMESDFIIIPLPKYNEEQANYRVNQYDGVPIYGLPVTLPEENIPMMAAVLEAMCSMTSDMVIPVYYDVALKTKYSRDPNTAQMIDIIHDSVDTDFAFIWADTVGGLIDIYTSNLENGKIASVLKRMDKIWHTNLTKLTETLASGND